MSPTGNGRWTGLGLEVIVDGNAGEADVTVSASRTQPEYILLRWDLPISAEALVLGDAFERSYGDLGWRKFTPGASSPWYVLWQVKDETHAVGVKTGAKSLAYWTLTGTQLELRLDVRSGNQPLRLEGRRLHAATLVGLSGTESSFHLLKRFCDRMSPHPRRVREPVYGINDWYYAYGDNSAEGIVRDAGHAAEWAGSHPNRPFCVIDAGWQASGGCEPGPYDRGNPRYGDMGLLAERIRSETCRPGIWIRPLYTKESLPKSWFMRDLALDPSVPEVLDHVRRDIARCHEWGYELIKHDFTTYDATGYWGFEMKSGAFKPGESFADTSRTTAEIFTSLYEAIREGAGDAYLIGCNTVGHLTAGTHEIQRIGDDTSGKEWDRTRRMGINTLAFRGAQNGSFFEADADCVGLTNDIPWHLNKQWLALVAASGTPLFVSAAPDALGSEQHQALKEAFAKASNKQPVAEPLDWQESPTPSRWRLQGLTEFFDWRG